jgi:butyryl-CoA dehydrogenase
MDFALSPADMVTVERARAFARDVVVPVAAAIDREARFPRDLVRELGGAGLLALTLPVDRGGGGQTYVAYAGAVEVVAAASATAAVIMAVTNSLVAEPILQWGTDGMRSRWLPALAKGEAVGAFALSEASAGSDAAHQQTLAEPVDGGWAISGEKVWVAHAEAADVAIVFAVTDTRPTPRHVSAFLVSLDASGISKSARDSLGVRGLGCMDLTFDRVRVGTDALLGGLGRGLPLAFRALEGGRVAIAAQALGVGQAALEEALEYARRHVAFGRPIAEFQAVQFQVADLVADLEAARVLTWKAADSRDRSPRVAVEAAMAKLAASEAAHRAADRAMQILASEGYRRGSTIERLFRDVRAAEIYQGTSEVQRMIIAEHVLGL